MLGLVQNSGEDNIKMHQRPCGSLLIMELSKFAEATNLQNFKFDVHCLACDFDTFHLHSAGRGIP